jgi:DNA-binding response OmpR family regulator
MTARILVADDSITIQKIVAMAFENEDAIVEGVGNGEEALDRLKTFKPDVVLADIDMPGLTGFELSREIKESGDLSSIYVLLLTNDFEEFDENHFQASLADNHITKPFKSEDLVKKVMALLEDGSPVVTDEDEEEEEEEEDEETEMVIELSLADRVDDVVITDPDEDQQTDTDEEFSHEDDICLDLSQDQTVKGLGFEGADLEVFSQESKDEGVEENPVLSDLQSDPLPEAAAIHDDPAETKTNEQEESLDDLLLKVEELSKKSDELSSNGTHEELSPLEAIDEMLKEVSALKEEAFIVSPEEENNSTETTAPQLFTEPASNGSSLAEVDYTSEENADTLATAFGEMTNGSANSFYTPATETDENQEPFFQEEAQGEAVETELANLTEEFSEHFLSPPEEDSTPDAETNTFPVSNEESTSPTEEILASADPDCDVNPENPEEPPMPEDSPLNQLMESEVRKVLQQSLTPLIEKEISGLSEKIMKAVEKNVRQVTPGIAKTIIEKEIDKIKTMEDG